MATAPQHIAFADRLRVLIVSDSQDADSDLTAGGLWHLAEALSPRNDVILAFPRRTGAQHADFAVIYYNQRNLGLLAADSDVVILAPGVRETNPPLISLGKFRVLTAGQILSEGLLPPGLREMPAGAEDLGAGGLVVLWPDAPAGPSGAGHHWRRLRYHLQHGGILRVASRGGALIKRRLRK